MTLGIYRATEDGNQRVLEDSVGLRVTENYKVGEASLVASSTLDAAAGLITGVFSNLTATSTLTSTGNIIGLGVSSLAGSSSLQAIPSRTTRGAIDFIASSSMLPNASLIAKGVSSLAATSSTSFEGRTVKFVTVVSGTLEFERITEIENTRITEDGNTRITNPIVTNVINGSMVANANVIPFSSIAYIKVDGVWKQVIEIDVNQQNSWGNLDKVYRNMSGKWKRIY
jgi:hypothetical protein